MNSIEKRNYIRWAGMKARCSNPKNPRWAAYGGRGITVCQRWNDYANFLEDMGLPSEGQSLDRIDNNLGYCPENCRWTNQHQQSRNMRNNIWIEIDGERMIMNDWSKRHGISSGTIHRRLRQGWTPEEAVKLKKKRHSVRVEYKEGMGAKFHQGHWYATTAKGGKRLYLAKFKTKEEASECYRQFLLEKQGVYP